MTHSIYTIGHSNRSGAVFLSMLQQAGITRLVDVRKIPRSRFNPQFNDKALARELNAHGISYRHMPELGGKRDPLPVSRNRFFRPEGGLQSYADYMASPAFHDAIDDLMAMDGTVAIMCAEAKPEQCHRQLIADALLQRGRDVIHLATPEVTRPHVMHEAARIDAQGQLYYPANSDQLAML